jgi:DNA-binding NarL/FixJ family response regulator
MDKAIQVVIADDHPIFRDGLGILLKVVKGFEVVGEACNGQEAVQITHRVEPDILLLDPALHGQPWLEVLRELRDRSLPTRTIILAGSIERYDVVKALQLGARGLVMKDSASELLIKAMHAVMAGQYWVGRESVFEFIGALNLTAREVQMEQLVIAGFSREIAKPRNPSPGIVKHHVRIVDNGLTAQTPLPSFAKAYVADVVRKLVRSVPGLCLNSTLKALMFWVVLVILAVLIWNFSK